MDCPKTPVDRLQEFRPPFCPHSDCPAHYSGRRFRYSRQGSYFHKSGRRVRRFRCSTCGRGFSQRTFSPDYYLKRPELLVPVFLGLVAGSANRQIARSLGCAPSTVTRLSARIGRHCMLFMARALAELQGTLSEPVSFDHLESFEFTQDYPFGIGTPVGRESWFVYGFDPAPHGRGGRLSPAQQKRLRKRPPRDRRGGYIGSTDRVLDLLVGLLPEGEQLHLASDDKPQYRQAARRHPASSRIVLAQFSNPPPAPKGEKRSPEGRARDRALYPVDELHALIRHSAAHHRRETIAFGRRLNALMERMAGLVVWRNFVKGRSERKPDRTTPAMRLGLADGPWSGRRIFSRRFFPSREHLPPIWRVLYQRDWTTPVLPSNTRHRLRHAA
jgi:transposase-like protein